MPPTAGSTNPTETSLSNIGFTPDANEDETSAVATEEPDQDTTADTSEESESNESLDTADETSEDEVSEEDSEEAAAGDTEEEPHGYDAMLPTRQLKSYPEELYALAAKKFGVDPQLANQKPIRDLLKGKIDADIDNRAMRERLSDFEGAEDEEQETEEEPTEETSRETERRTVPPEKQYEAINRFLREGADGQTPIITEQGAKLYSDVTLDAYTQLQEALEKGEPKGIAAAQRNYAESQASFVTAMFANVLPHLLPGIIQNLDPRTWDPIVGAKLEERDTMRSIHKEARTELSKDARYKDIDSLVKSGALFRFAQENPEMFDKQFRDANGNVIRDPLKLEMARYRYAIHQIRGANYRPPAEYVKKGVEAGKRQAAELEQRRKAGRRLAGGSTRGILGTDADRYAPDNWTERMKKAGASSDPLGSFLNATKP